MHAPTPADGDQPIDVLRTPEAGGRVVRGGAVRAVGFAVGTALGFATAVLLLRFLGVGDFGRYATVSAVLGIVAGVTDAGLTAVGSREMASSTSASERRRLLDHLLVLRVIGASSGAVAAVAFAVVAGYDSTMIAGTALGGLGVVLVSVQSMLTLPIWVELRILSLTALDVFRNLVTLVGVSVLVVAGASLLPFFGVQILVGLVTVPVTVAVARLGIRGAGRIRRDMLLRLLRDTLPLAVAFAMSIMYFRVLMILVSLLSDDIETGLFGTSFRIFEMLLGLPALVLSVALPLLTVAGDEDEHRLRRALQSMTEASLLIAALLVLAIAILADPLIQVVGGDEYAGAAGVLRIQAIALVPLFLGQTWAMGLIAGRAQRSMAIANGLALVLVLVLGLAVVGSAGATGAAWVAVGAETALALFLWVAVGRMRASAAPSLVFAWKVVAASAAAGGIGYVLRDTPVLAAVAALPAFVIVAALTRAIPADALHAFGILRDREAR